MALIALKELIAFNQSISLFSVIVQDWWDSKLPESGIISWLSVIPKVLLAGVITLMDELYYKLAVWLNDQGLKPQIIFLNDYRLLIVDKFVRKLS
jgi:hypothetical protein